MTTDSIITGLFAVLEQGEQALDLGKISSASSKGTFSMVEAQREANICFFLYSFMTYTYDWYKREAKPEAVVAAFRKVWDALLQFVT